MVNEWLMNGASMSDSALGNVGEHSSRKVPSSLIKKPACMVGYSRGNSKQIGLGLERISYRIVYKVCYHRNDEKWLGEKRALNFRECLTSSQFDFARHFLCINYYHA